MLAKSSGNMYSWVSHMHTHLGGKCLHECSYCYVGKGRFGTIPRYEGQLRLIEGEFDVDYGTGKTIFMEHMNDAFGEAVPQDFIERILAHCRKYSGNTYVFQSKNPYRFIQYLNMFPSQIMLGTTIETNRIVSISKAPSPEERFEAMIFIRELYPLYKLFITIEPIMKFDLKEMIDGLVAVKPNFINIGADSKKCGLPEPTKDEVQALIKAIQQYGLNIRIKNNLERFLS
jgi:DNA repair photolyase